MQDEFLTTPDNCRIAYQYLQTTASHPTFVLLHGLGGDLAVWHPLAQALHQSLKANCLLIDLRGHGLSTKTIPPGIQADLSLYARDVALIIKHLNIKKPILVGHCFGGNVALLVRDMVPATATITINTAPYTTSTKSYLLQKSLCHSQFFFRPKKTPGRQNINRSKHHRDIDFSRIRDDIQRTGINSYLFALNSFVRHKPNNQTPDNDSPLIAILGAKDMILPLNSTKQLYRQYTDAHIHTIEDNHLIPLNQSANDLSRLLTQLLATHGVNHFKPQIQ
jgi:pimeloyl-ACP methyl ester carboxylesterase